MGDIRILGPAAAAGPAGAPQQAAEKANGFDGILDEALGALSRVQADAESAARELSRGGDVTQAMIAMEKADMAFQLMVEVRNRLLSAYEEIMRMQV